jgi:hypothetical protein
VSSTVANVQTGSPGWSAGEAAYSTLRAAIPHARIFRIQQPRQIIAYALLRFGPVTYLAALAGAANATTF